jgi:hypothetical protein
LWRLANGPLGNADAVVPPPPEPPPRLLVEDLTWFASKPVAPLWTLASDPMWNTDAVETLDGTWLVNTGLVFADAKRRLPKLWKL